MLISRIRVLNYKSFFDSNWIEFKPGINIITGQNSSGKTALLEALTLVQPNNPHRSLKTIPTATSLLNTISRIKFCLNFERDEANVIASQIPSPYIIGIPIDSALINQVPSLMQNWMENPLLSSDYKLCLTITPSGLDAEGDKKIMSFSLYETDSFLNGNYLLIDKDGEGNLCHQRTSMFSHNDTMVYKFFEVARKNIYRFYAERLNIGSCSRTGSFSSDLNQNASNLPEVLGIMQGDNPSLFKLFNEYVSIVFPQIRAIAILQSHNIEIKVWYVDPSTFRNDLSFSLADCGTGFGQVLAILYVVLTSRSSRIIIIDEPQSFLHPGAAKKLIEVLKEIGKDSRFPQHQYIISTHSPTIISAAEPSTITMLRFTEDCETQAKGMNANENHELKLILADIGVRLSDVFGMDKILWVEGPTEEKCFPLIIDKTRNQALRGIQILAVKNTGDLEGKKANIIFDVYDKLSGSQSLFLPAIGFIFDRECRSEQEILDLQKRSINPVRFLNRRMYENYLLHPESIAIVLNDLDDSKESPLTVAEVNAVLHQAMQNKHYFPKHNQDNLQDSEWILNNIDAAKLLQDLFSTLSETRVEFSKTRDSIRLTECLLEKQPEVFREIANTLDEVLDSD